MESLTNKLECLVEEWQQLGAVVVVDWNAMEMSVLYKRRLRTRDANVQDVRYVVYLQ